MLYTMNTKLKKFSVKEKNKISFTDNIFYWIWTSVPSKGFPDRTFAILTIFQFSYALFFVSILLTLFNDEIQLWIYNKPEPIAIPMCILFIALLLINMKIYNEKKYKKLASNFRLMPIMEKKKSKNIFFLFSFITILIILTDIILLYSYNSHINNLMQKEYMRFIYTQ